MSIYQEGYQYPCQTSEKLCATLQWYDIRTSIVGLLINGMLWNDYSETPTCIKVGDSKMNIDIQLAIAEQIQIGWSNTRQGFLSTQWPNILRLYIGHRNVASTTEWNKFLVKQVLDVSWNMWEARNEHLHG